MMADEDPFAVFGDDDDDGDDEVVAHVSSEAQQLLQSVNKRMQDNLPVVDASPNILESRLNKQESMKLFDLSTLKIMELAWDSPLYMGPIMCVSLPEYGGGRAFVASQDLKPGTLLIVEQPAIEWSNDQLGKELGLVSVRHILQHVNAKKLVHDLEDFHPTKDAVDEFKTNDIQVRAMIELFEEKVKEQLPAMVDLATNRGIYSRNGTMLTSRDIVRLLLALRYNGFESGVYLHLAMINHSCYPNSVKFFPSKDYSEVRTTRCVKAGEPITISYLPRIASHATRRQHLWDQHLFDIAGHVPAEYECIENVGGVIPTSSPDVEDNSSVTYRVEQTIDALVDHYNDAAASIARENTSDNPIWEEVKALEATALELYTEAKEQLQNDRHVLLVACLRLHLDLCDLIQIGKVLTPSQHILLLLRVVRSTCTLLDLQTLLYGRDHFELARTHNELSQALSELLARAPKQLVDLGLEGMHSQSACSSTEFRARKEFERIRDLYPRDAEQYVAKNVDLK